MAKIDVRCPVCGGTNVSDNRLFIWDFLASLVLDQIVDWIYNSVVGFLGDFFALMGQMGAELFDLPWVEAVTMFFGNFAWALYITGIVVAGFECAIEAQNGRGDIKATCLNILKGFFVIPIQAELLGFQRNGFTVVAAFFFKAIILFANQRDVVLYILELAVSCHHAGERIGFVQAKLDIQSAFSVVLINRLTKLR